MTPLRRRSPRSRGAARLLGHDFARPELLDEALTHPSALPPAQRARADGRAEAPARGAPRGDYERLEFLGDRVLGLVVADLLVAALRQPSRRGR